MGGRDRHTEKSTAENVEKLKLLYTAGKNVNHVAIVKNSLAVPQKHRNEHRITICPGNSAHQVCKPNIKNGDLVT